MLQLTRANLFLDAAVLYAPAIADFTFGAIVFTLLDRYPKLKCNTQPPWWKNSSIASDLLFLTVNPLFKATLRFLPVAALTAPLLLFMPIEDVYSHLANGLGPLSRLPGFMQCLVFLILSDFLLYWSHRLFHQSWLWPAHTIHHAPVDVDWTTAYRFHPLNIVLGPWLITTFMIFLGVSPHNILLIAPIEVAMAYFVHSNLNATLGPLKFVVATPVFHRWHHARRKPSDACNFGANLAVWDVAFGTFFLPADILPEDYGVIDDDFPENFLPQLLHPFVIAAALMSRVARSR